MMEERVKLTMAISIPIWTAMSIFVIVAAIYAGLNGLGIAFAAVFFATIFWYVTITRIIGGEHRESVSRGGSSIENRLSAIEEKINQLATLKKE